MIEKRLETWICVTWSKYCFFSVDLCW